jgi:hypothetical protein
MPRDRGGVGPPKRVRPAGRRGALRLVVNNRDRREFKPIARIGQEQSEPGGLTDWDYRFLTSLARWPLLLRPEQRVTLEWIARRGRLRAAP